MNPARVRTLVLKDLAIGPRSPLVLWALVLPIVITLLVRGVFGGLLSSEPRLGIVDQGGSALVAEARSLAGIEVRSVADADTLDALLAAGDLDAGLILPVGFDAAVRSGAQPTLDLAVAGDSLASDRIVLALTAVDLARGLDGRSPPIDIEVVALGEPSVPFDLRVLPMLVMMAVAIAGAMIPAAGLVEEKAARTLDALLVTPTTMSEVLLAKGLVGVILGLAAGIITLVVNGVLGTAPLVTLLAIGLGAAMMAQLGLIVGAWAPDTNTLFAAWKGGGILLFYPVVFFIWPGLPTWVARLGPTYYVLRPVYVANVEAAGFADVWLDLTVAAVIVVALIPAVAAAGRRLQGRSGRRVHSARDRQPAG